MPRPPSAILPTPRRRPLMANIMQSQAVQQQLRVQGSLKQPISSPASKAVSNSPSATPCPCGSSRTKNWRRPLMVRQPYSVAVRSPSRSGYIPLLLRRRGLGGRGGPSLKGKGGLVGFRKTLNGKEGRVGFRKNEVELPLERVFVPYKGNRRGRKDY